jgi:hypothetical protein
MHLLYYPILPFSFLVFSYVKPQILAHMLLGLLPFRQSSKILKPLLGLLINLMYNGLLAFSGLRQL